MTEITKKKIKDWIVHNLMLEVVILVLLTGFIIVTTMLVKLTQEIETLKAEIGFTKGFVMSINGNMNAQINYFLEEMSETLDSESSLIASCDATVDTYKIENNQLPLVIKIVPKVDYEDLKIEVIINGKKTYRQMAIEDQGTYIAKVPIDITEKNLKFHIQLSHGGVVNNEAIDLDADILQSYLMRTDAEGEFTFIKSGNDLKVSGKVILIYDPMYERLSYGDANLLCYPVSKNVIIKVNDHIVKELPAKIEMELQSGEYSNCNEWIKVSELIEETSKNDHIEIIGELVDNYGNKYTYVVDEFIEK